MLNLKIDIDEEKREDVCQRLIEIVDIISKGYWVGKGWELLGKDPEDVEPIED